MHKQAAAAAGSRQCLSWDAPHWSSGRMVKVPPAAGEGGVVVTKAGAGLLALTAGLGLVVLTAGLGLATAAAGEGDAAAHVERQQPVGDGSRAALESRAGWQAELQRVCDRPKCLPAMPAGVRCSAVCS